MVTPEMKRERLCFVIGRMGGANGEYLDRLEQLAFEIVEPLLRDAGYTVEVPANPESGRIMKQVIQRLDQADIVIADVTGGNPNVMYELGIRHALGLQYVVVTEDNTVPFDIRDYLYTKIDINKIRDARDKLEPVLAISMQNVERDKLGDNPVTDYYNAAMTEISAAPGLALGYYNNFVSRIIRDVRQNEYQLTINGEVIPLAVRKTIPLMIIKPPSLAHANALNIHDLLVEPGILQEAMMKMDGGHRSFSLHAYQETNGEWLLADVPTTLTSITQTIEQRFPSTPNPDSPDWKRLEEQEIDRFFAVFGRMKANEKVLSIKDRIVIKDWDALSPRMTT